MSANLVSNIENNYQLSLKSNFVALNEKGYIHHSVSLPNAEAIYDAVQEELAALSGTHQYLHTVLYEDKMYNLISVFIAGNKVTFSYGPERGKFIESEPWDL